MNIIKNIIRYPIKGLSGEYLDKILLEVNQTIPGDREYAFARLIQNLTKITLFI